MRIAVIGAVLGLLLAARAPDAAARQVWYSGPHPISKAVLKGMCYIPGRHVHSYSPSKPLLYARSAKAYSFVGDPVEFEIEAPHYAYYGHHPVFWVKGYKAGHHYCYITGPHDHWYKPPAGLPFKLKGHAYWFVGPRPAWYKKDHPRVKLLREHYHSIGIPVPEVKVSAPPVGFAGLMVGAAFLTGHALLRYRGGRWHGQGPAFSRWHGGRWKRPKWRRGHWHSPLWRSRWKHRRWKHRRKRRYGGKIRYRGKGRYHPRRRAGRRYGGGGGTRTRRGK